MKGMVRMIKPIFNKKMQKDKMLDFFSEERFRAEHPIAYKIIAACEVAAFLLPLIIYMIFVFGIYRTPDNPWMALGLIGDIVMGIGFSSIVAAWMGEYLGHLVTGICIGAGASMVGVSVIFTYDRTLFALFDQKMVSYYFLNLLYLCIPAIYYGMFRVSIGGWLQAKRIGLSRIEKYKKGKKNFWWYEKINEEYDLGLLYGINRLFTIVYPAALILHLLFGWIKLISIPVSFLLVLSGVLSALMSLFSSVQSNKEEHGRPIVLIARGRNDGIDSFLLDLIAAAFPLGMVYAELIAISDLWQLSWKL